MATTYPFSPLDVSKEYRAGGRGKVRAGAKPYARRRRSAKAAAAQAGVLRQFWDAHALKAGIAVFWLWFATANSQALQQLLLP